MRMIDIVIMAIHNMLRRPFRTTLNLLGIILGTTIILMTLAGTDGVKNALGSLFENSEITRKVVARRSSKVNESMLDDSLWRIDGEMNKDRRQRMESALKDFLLDELRAKDGRFLRINRETLGGFEAIENAQDAVPRVWLRFLIEMDEFSAPGVAEGVSPKAVGMSERIVAGQMLGDDDLQGVLVHELLAHQMGYTTKDELNSLVGKEIVLTFQGEGRGNQLASLLAYEPGKTDLESIGTQVEILQALGSLVNQIDLSNLTEEQKQLIQSKFKPALEKGVETQAVKKSFVIKGVYHTMTEDLFRIFSQFTFDSADPILFHYKTAIDLQVDVRGRDDFYDATIFVDSYQDVPEVQAKIDEMGYKTFSVVTMLKDVDKRIDEIGRVIFIVALIILLMTVFAISNTLVMSVMERTSEFGIMKSLGAKDKHIVWLMLVEGALTGAIGAAIAILVSLLLAKFGQGFLRAYVEGRVNQVVTGEVFSFSTTSMVWAFIGAILICSLASIIPAWRAARLDPIVAMQRK